MSLVLVDLRRGHSALRYGKSMSMLAAVTVLIGVCLALLASSASAGIINSDNDWLYSHNVRRKFYHDLYGKNYIPL
eukprot:scaffold662090_cov84-Prasinocladus_malaysianus.AAC.1